MTELQSRRTNTGDDSPNVYRSVGTDWVWSLGVMAISLAGVTLLFLPTAVSIVSIWMRSETYAHGFLIVPIALWLVWEKRQGVARLKPLPAITPLLLLIPLGLVWLVGFLVDALVVQQYAYVGMLIVVIWASLGHQAAWYLMFPISFLVLAVPVGEGLVQPMMNFTADFTVGALKLIGMPVYREGNFFTIPSGRWSVVSACSGMRYLIASVTLGVLFAYLTYSKTWKRLLFVLAATIIPIIANGLRAFMIVMIGHWSGMKLAVGVDHLIYGWVFFGIIVTIMFVVGSFWRDPPQELPAPTPSDGERAGARRSGLVLGGTMLLACIWPLLAHGVVAERSEPVAVDVSAPSGQAGWSATNESFWDWRPRVVGADGSKYAFYVRDGDDSGRARSVAGLYLGVYGRQRPGAELVTSVNVMVKEKDPTWSEYKVLPRELALASGRFEVIEHRLVSASGQRLLVWTWYRVSGHDTANPYVAKILEALGWFRGRGGPDALVAIAAPYVEQPSEAASTLTEFLRVMIGPIGRAVDLSVEPVRLQGAS